MFPLSDVRFIIKVTSYEVCVLDPRTGRNLKSWPGKKFADVYMAAEILTESSRCGLPQNPDDGITSEREGTFTRFRRDCSLLLGLLRTSTSCLLEFQLLVLQRNFHFTVSHRIYDGLVRDSPSFVK